jgi:tetrahydromethanopterin S-methyltransferase subunit A
MQILIETKVVHIHIVLYKTCDKYIVVCGSEVDTHYNLCYALAQYNNAVTQATYNYLGEEY